MAAIRVSSRELHVDAVSSSLSLLELEDRFALNSSCTQHSDKQKPTMIPVQQLVMRSGQKSKIDWEITQDVQQVHAVSSTCSEKTFHVEAMFSAQPILV